MATITITGSNIENGNLYFDVGNHIRAKKKEIIIWKLGAGCGVNDIVEISIKQHEPYPAEEFFSELPKRLGKSKDWRAVVTNTTPRKSDYNYNINWITTVGTTPYTCDPKISIMPEKFVSIQKVVLFILAIFTACAGAILFTKKGKKKK